VVASEGVKLPGGEYMVDRRDPASHDPIRLGGISVWLAQRIQEETGISSRSTILGHLQRGGSPTAFDRVLATRLGARAMHCAAEGRFDVMVGLRGTEIEPVPLAEIADRQRLVPPDHPLIAAARSTGATFGDE
jgi:6-phosphofructokinase 1